MNDKVYRELEKLLCWVEDNYDMGTPETIIPYDELKNYKNQEDTFEADEDRQEEDSNNLSKQDIKKYE